MAPEVSYPLARAVKRVLDVVRILAISALIIWPLVVVALTLGKPAGSDSWGVDVSVQAALRLDLGELGAELDDSSGVRDPVIKGRTPLTVDTSSTKAHLVSALVVEIGGLVGLYILLQLRAVFGHLANGDTFNPDSARRIKIMGVAVLAWALLGPTVRYFGGYVILGEYALQAPGISLRPAFIMDLLQVFIGLAMLVLAGVLKEAAAMRDEQRLTI